MRLSLGHVIAVFALTTVSGFVLGRATIDADTLELVDSIPARVLNVSRVAFRNLETPVLVMTWDDGQVWIARTDRPDSLSRWTLIAHVREECP